MPSATSLILQGEWGQDEKPSFDDKSLLRFISNCQGHDGGFGQAPLLEGHSGLNFCAIAALACLDKLKGETTDRNPCLHLGSIDIKHNIHWMLQRQTAWVDEDDTSSSDSGSDEDQDQDSQYPVGFNGRLGKMADTCYCFWNAGALSILSSSQDTFSQPSPADGSLSQQPSPLDLIDGPGLRTYLLTKNAAHHRRLREGSWCGPRCDAFVPRPRCAGGDQGGRAEGDRLGVGCE